MGRGMRIEKSISDSNAQQQQVTSGRLYKGFRIRFVITTVFFLDARWEMHNIYYNSSHIWVDNAIRFVEICFPVKSMVEPMREESGHNLPA